MREWDIPFQELQFGEPIGQGRFGTVHRGNWHGDVAIRLLSMDQVGDEKVLESFKHEVSLEVFLLFNPVKVCCYHFPIGCDVSQNSP